MRAVVCERYGGPEVLKVRERAKPKPEKNEVLIKIEATAVTTAGLLSRKGHPWVARLFNGWTKPKNDILGMEFAGIIDSVGISVMKFAPGDAVFGLTGMDLGANAEYACLSEDGVIAKMPNNLSFAGAAAVIEGGLTANHFLRNKANIQPGQRILVYGASGSIGTSAIQLAKHYNANVTGVTSKRNTALVKSLGADTVIDYTQNDVSKSKEKYDIVFDTLGKLDFLSCLKVLNPNGVYLSSTGTTNLFHMLWTSFYPKRVIISATYLRPKKTLKNELSVLKTLLEQNALRPVIDRIYAMHQVSEAHQYVETKRKKGNVVLTISDHIPSSTGQLTHNL